MPPLPCLQWPLVCIERTSFPRTVTKVLFQHDSSLLWIHCKIVVIRWVYLALSNHCNMDKCMIISKQRSDSGLGRQSCLNSLTMPLCLVPQIINDSNTKTIYELKRPPATFLPITLICLERSQPLHQLHSFLKWPDIPIWARQGVGPRFVALSLNKSETPCNFQFITMACCQQQPCTTCEQYLAHICKGHKMPRKVHSNQKWRGCSNGMWCTEND